MIISSYTDYSDGYFSISDFVTSNGLQWMKKF